jgi:hypothetical protein
MNSKLELNGTDFNIEIKDIMFDKKYSATIEFNILLDILYLCEIGGFLENTIKTGLDEEELLDKKFKIEIGDIGEDSSSIKFVGDFLTLSINDFQIDTKFNLNVSTWLEEITTNEIKEISKIQKKTWYNMDSKLTGEEINKVWDKEWQIIIEEM